MEDKQCDGECGGLAFADQYVEFDDGWGNHLGVVKVVVYWCPTCKKIHDVTVNRI